MLEVGNILHFTPFHFKNNKGSKDKFFIVLKHIDDKVILASLPSSKDHVPSYIDVEKTGCVEVPGANFNCFAILPDTSVTECGKSFKRNTFLYGHLLDDYDVVSMKKIYQIQNVNFSIFGKMQKHLFEKMISCFKNSKSIKKKYIRCLSL